MLQKNSMCRQTKEKKHAELQNHFILCSTFSNDKFSNSDCLYFLSLCLFLGPKMTIVSLLTWIQVNNTFATVCSVLFTHMELFPTLIIKKPHELKFVYSNTISHFLCKVTPWICVIVNYTHQKLFLCLLRVASQMNFKNIFFSFSWVHWISLFISFLLRASIFTVFPIISCG